MLAMAMRLARAAVVVRVMAPPAPPAPGSRLLSQGSEPAPPWLVASRALPIGVQGLRVMLTPLGIALFATLSSKVAFEVIDTLQPAPALYAPAPGYLLVATAPAAPVELIINRAGVPAREVALGGAKLAPVFQMPGPFMPTPTVTSLAMFALKLGPTM